MFGPFVASTDLRQAKALAMKRYNYWNVADAVDYLGTGYETFKTDPQPKTFHRRPAG